METGAGKEEEKQVEFQLGGRHLTLAVVGLALFGVVLFLLGRWSERVARPEDAAAEEIGESIPADSRGAPDPAQPRELTFYETLGKKGTPGFQESSSQASRREPPAVLPERSSPPPPTAGKAPADPPAGAREAEKAPSPAGAGERFRIQVASTRDGAAARALVERLRKKGYAASLESIRGEDGRIQYKVRVGNYSQRAPAEEEAARIRSEEKMGAWIVKVQG